jgi:hypothetical protein
VRSLDSSQETQYEYVGEPTKDGTVIDYKRPTFTGPRFEEVDNDEASAIEAQNRNREYEGTPPIVPPAPNRNLLCLPFRNGEISDGEISDGEPTEADS